MKGNWKMLLIPAAMVLGVGFFSFVAANGLSAAATPEEGGMTCEKIAEAVRRTAHLEARADYWIAVADCLNEEDHPRAQCIQVAREEQEEAVELAEEQWAARLEVCAMLGHGAYDANIEPFEFSSDVTHPYWPLVVGRTLIYEAQTDEGLETIEVTTLDETVEIDGFECRTVRDVVTLEGVCIEDTDDWYAQRWNGDVWYMGEVAQNFEDGFLDNLDGSWRTGKDNAEPGIIMLGIPTVGAIYRQEYLVNEAEDMARVIATGQTVAVPAGTFTDCIQIEEWAPVEPGIFAHKFYAPGIGSVLEIDLDSGQRTELVAIVN